MLLGFHINLFDKFKDNGSFHFYHGKVFRLPIASIPFTLMDIRKLLKNLTSDINSIILESSLKDFSHGKYNFVYTLTQNGYIKRMSCEEFFNVPASGLIYIKLEEMDIVKDVIFADCRQDIFLYAGNKTVTIQMFRNLCTYIPTIPHFPLSQPVPRLSLRAYPDDV